MSKKVYVTTTTAVFAALLILASCAGATNTIASPGNPSEDAIATSTPIKHLVVIFDENIS